MVHSRLNERESNPNPHINHITALPAPHASQPCSEDRARHILRALAAQVRPIMKDHGFEINSFEEYEYNRVFAGRNWNAGEVVELVLRRADGTFVPVPWLMSTLCHELAHIKHMNHGPAFQTLWAQLRREVTALQCKGYYGDGYWSSGTRLEDSARVGGQGIGDYELPEYICGGAQTRERPKHFARRPRRQTAKAGPSNHSGAQVPKKRKAGSRVTAKNAFKGQGVSLETVDRKAAGAGFGKQAGSKRAREERALAAEKRLKLLNGAVASGPKPEPPDSETESDSGDDRQRGAETDEVRRRVMQDVTKEDELESMRAFMREFLAEAGIEGARGLATQSTRGGGRMVQDEIDTRMKESLQVGPRRLGSGRGWACVVCTLDNEKLDTACRVCGTGRL